MSRLNRLSLLFLVLGLVLITISGVSGQVSTSRKALLRQKKEIESEVDKLLKSGRETDAEVVQAISRYARVLFNLAEHRKALKWQRRLQKIERKTLPTRDRGHIDRFLSLAKCQQALDKPKEAQKVVRQAIDKVRKWWKAEPRSDALCGVGIRCHGMSLFELGREAFEEALEERRQRLGPDDKNTLYAALGVGACLIETDRVDDAIPVLEDTLARVEKHHPELGIRVVLRNNLAAVHLRKKEYGEAKSALEPLFEDAKKSGSGGLDWTIRTNYIAALEGLHEYNHAIEHAESMIADLEVNKRANKSSIEKMKDTIERCQKARREAKKTQRPHAVTPHVESTLSERGLQVPGHPGTAVDVDVILTVGIGPTTGADHGDGPVDRHGVAELAILESPAGEELKEAVGGGHLWGQEGHEQAECEWEPEIHRAYLSKKWSCRIKGPRVRAHHRQADHTRSSRPGDEPRTRDKGWGEEVRLRTSDSADRLRPRSLDCCLG